MNNSLTDLTVKGFLDTTAGKDPVPGGGSISALCGSIAAALTEMVAGLTIGKKKYAEVEEQMKQLVERVQEIRHQLILDVDRDSEAYNVVFAAFQMPKETDEQKAARSAQIQEATKIAANVPMEVARRVYSLLSDIEEVVSNGNQNAVTDGCVAMMSARNAIIGALFNVRINLTSIKDEQYVADMTAEADRLEREVIEREAKVIEYTKEACK
ncbi:cyclodeaminase/cyclohydrolase family protein [Porphyromonas asaccharolytica]|uniref:Glutamate formimidoyltransferase n=1 Tax=Porphyromonas asaccharolytica (strain ATCC 25260 / DSM 20707 / BCRC 10618 / CCUG 7834 / JCM 6326 / LMG 13178 / VPI 4198 / B440) TaxID=879243 RepID=F4KMJ0_PORAD|nr:cyclodeaminase/cyclohydrolase family protein [Porphyromonas asaccharolytica]AEE13289.1 Glutamate formimidoyltransferase [Porphyromonas asaccharolytica DSM 20707]EFR34700.1 Formiminotransferase-cyclodeaminase [Porphyromonas asaccharolytica PR426713P-I]